MFEILHFFGQILYRKRITKRVTTTLDVLKNKSKVK